MGRPGNCSPRIGVYGPCTRALQRSLSYEIFGLTFKQAMVYKYLGDRSNATPDIDDIHSIIFSEVPDRAYEATPISMPIGMERLTEGSMDFSRFGVMAPLTEETMFRVHIDDFDLIGRSLIVGDVFEMPFFEKDGKKSFWEVTDVDDKVEAEKFITIVYASPIGTSRKTREIPIDNSNDDYLNDIMTQGDEDFEENMKTDEPTFDEPATSEDVDYRYEEHASFLDDPTKTF